MTYNFQTFTADSTDAIIKLKADKRAFRIVGVYSDKMNLSELHRTGFTLNVIYQKNGTETTQPISIGSVSSNSHGSLEYLEMPFLFPDINNDHVKVYIGGFKEEMSTLTLIYDLENLSIPISDPFKEFEAHLNDKKNSKILFSAPFGHGKTTFLNLFFEKKESDYEVFHIYPVNFSIAQNEDVFRYIKTELLFQLLKKDVIFDKEKVPYAQTLKKYLGANAHKVLTPFIKLIPGIGKSAFDIITSLDKLKEEFFEEHDQQQVDDEQQALSYIQEVYEQEGSIFEDNFYTQLIRQLLEQIKETGKKVVLIIDDLDRMDPDHIFRILNVLSAHVDENSKETITSSNKFGFDKTIIVGDFGNLTSIFKHKYGSNTDYRGYFDKFFSKSIYHFDNNKAVEYHINQLTVEDNSQREIQPQALYLRMILLALLYNKKISLREIIQLQDFDKSELSKTYSSLGMFVPFRILSPFIPLDELLEKLKGSDEKYSANQLKRDLYFNYYAFQIMITLATKVIDNGSSSYEFNFEGDRYSFTTESKMRHTYINESSLLINNKKPEELYEIFDEKKLLRLISLLAQYYKINQVEIDGRFDNAL